MFYGTLEVWKGTKIYSVGKRILTVYYSLTKEIGTQFVVWRLKSLNVSPRVYWQGLKQTDHQDTVYQTPNDFIRP